MPRPKQPGNGKIVSEQMLARRIKFEREKIGRSYEALAIDMEKAGRPIHATGIYKIENAGRQITVDELVAFARVFKVPVEEMLQPPEKELAMLFVAWDNARRETHEADERELTAWNNLREYVAANPDTTVGIETAFEEWAKHYFGENPPEDVTARNLARLYKLTGDIKYLDLWHAIVDAATTVDAD